MDWSNPGSNDFHIYKDGFHDRLARYWPEPREQLHSGGWARTQEMVDDIKRLTAGQPGGVSRVLDLCCGEGATAAYLAATEGWEVTGVELVESAVMVARARAEQYGIYVRVKLDTAPVEAVSSSVSYDTAIGVMLAPTEGGEYPSPVRCNLSYGTAVGVTLSSSEDETESPVRCNLSYNTAVGLGLKVATNPGNAEESSPVRCSLSYTTVVGGKLTAAPPPVASAKPIVRLRLSYNSVPDLVRIAHASIHYMPLPSNSYDVVYGQDPDGLANENRLHAFREVLRVLRPGGLFYFWHHWIPGPGWRRELLEEYWADPITGSPRLSHECYVEDLRASGLHLASVYDTTSLAASHMGAMADRMRAELPPAAAAAASSSSSSLEPHPDGGGLPDKWLERALQFAARGGSMGIHAVAFKPPAPVTSAP